MLEGRFELLQYRWVFKWKNILLDFLRNQGSFEQQISNIKLGFALIDFEKQINVFIRQIQFLRISIQLIIKKEK